jgi:hypothetical protein
MKTKDGYTIQSNIVLYAYLQPAFSSIITPHLATQTQDIWAGASTVPQCLPRFTFFEAFLIVVTDQSIRKHPQLNKVVPLHDLYLPLHILT